jgi:hypothetical protein
MEKFQYKLRPGTPGHRIKKPNRSIGNQIVFYQNPKFEDRGQTNKQAYGQIGCIP